MSARRPSELLRGLAGTAHLDEQYARRYPFAKVALAVAQLRGRLGLTQAEFASRIGTTQSAVARLESGRHGIQVALLNRIAAALDVDWDLSFVDDPSQAAVGGDSAVAAGTGDELLDAFNVANTGGDLASARRLAQRIRRDPSSPRRILAVALEAYNRGRLKDALRWATSALGQPLPPESEDVARLVAGRCCLALGKAQDALDILSGAREGLAAATRAEAMIELDRVGDAIRVAEHLLEVAEPDDLPAARYLAARVYWHADRPLTALSHAAAFRALRPQDADAAAIHGAILGHLGDLTGDEEAYEQAMLAFEAMPVDAFPEGLRLRAMTAARLRHWRDAIDCLAAFVERQRDTPASRRTAADVMIDAFDRLDDPDELQAAVEHASEAGLVDGRTRRRYLATARAQRGDFEEAVAALGLTVDRLEDASPSDQIRCARALAIGHQPARAYPILMRNRAALSVPDGHLFLAQAALAARDLSTAREALDTIAADRGSAAETARVAMDLVSAIERVGTEKVLERLSLTWQGGQPRVLEARAPASAPESPWEGDGPQQHEPAFAVLDRFAREHVAQAPIQ